MSKNYTVMELEAIKHLCKCVNSVASLPTNLIADTNVATNTTYSSYKIDAEMSALENDIQAYVDTALAGLNKLTKEVIDDKALVVKENVLYLYKDPADINNDYMQMMLINGVVVELGTTQADFSSVYSKDEIDDKFALKIDLDVLTTSFNNLVTTVDKKIDKDKIATVLDDTVTDDKVASALLTKTELDKTNAKLGELSDSLVDIESALDELEKNVKLDVDDLNTAYVPNKTITVRTNKNTKNLPQSSMVNFLVTSFAYIEGQYYRITQYCYENSENLSCAMYIRRGTSNAGESSITWSAWKELATMDKIGSTDISSIGDGTVTGAIDTINTSLESYSIPINTYMGLNHYLAIKINVHDMNYSFNISDRSGNIYAGAFFSYNGSFSVQIKKINNSSTKNGYILGFRQYKVSGGEIYLVMKVSDYNHINGVINTSSVLKPNIEILVNDDSTLWDKGTDIVVKELATMDKVEDIPTKVSELTNDSNYQTAKQVNSAVTTEIAKVETELKGNIEELSNNLDELEKNVKLDADDLNTVYVPNKTITVRTNANTKNRPPSSLTNFLVTSFAYIEGQHYRITQYCYENSENLSCAMYIRRGTSNAGESSITWSAWTELATMDKVEELSSNLDELFQSVSDGKTLVANAITDKGVSTSTTATFATMATNISKINGYKEETKSYNNTSSNGTRLKFTFSADIIAVKQIVVPTEQSYIVPQTLTDMFTINGKELILYVTGSGTWKVTALIQN